MGIKISS